MEEKPKRSFVELAARAAWILPVLAFFVMAVAQRSLTRPEGQITTFIVSGLLLLLLLGGIVSGVIGCFGIKRYGVRKALVPGLIGACLSLAMLGLLTFIAVRSFAYFQQESRTRDLQAMVDQTNKQLPMMTDRETRADRLAVLGPGRLEYNYTFVNQNKETFDVEGFTGDVQPQLLANYLTNPKFKTLRDSGISIQYTYRDKNGQLLTSIVVPASETVAN
ncbi:MAG: hypothetical protein AB1921_08680 [Thermodesulfobacteriota bacterium]